MILFSVAFCASASAQSLVNHADLDSLRHYVIGSFRSIDSANGSHQALNVNAIWSHRIDGLWLYAEEAWDSSLSQPYRQSVYHFFPINDTTIVRQTYDPVNPAGVAGGWHNPKLFEPLRPDSLKLQVGCAVMIRKNADGSYGGRTREKQCAREYGGAAYVTTELEIYPDKTVLRERGWDMYDKPIQDAANTETVFIKRK